METRADRLNGLVRRAFPSLGASMDKGQWHEPVVGRDGQPREAQPGAPYAFDTISDGRQRLRFTDPVTGETMTVLGANRDELLDAMASKLTAEGK